MSTGIAIVPSTLLRLGVGALGLAAVGVLVVQGSEAAFTADTKNAGNSVTAGTVVLGDSDGGTAMFNIGNLNGGQILTRCITVSYSGNLEADIKLHGTSNGNLADGVVDLADGMKTKIEIGTGTELTGGAGFDCTGFTATSTLFPVSTTPANDTLTHFGANHGTYSTGLGGFDGATATPASNATKHYKITMTVPNETETVKYQGKTATASFTWEAEGQDGPTGNKG